MPVSKYTNAMGNPLLRELFYEMTMADKSQVLYTLKREDHEGYPSLYQLYMASVLADPMEYHFATTYLDGWSHWERLQESTWFKPYLEKWRREADVRQKAISLKQVLTVAKSGSRESLAASKYLLEKGWVPKPLNGKGRPSKEEVHAELQRQAEEDKSLQSDAERLGVRVQ